MAEFSAKLDLVLKALSMSRGQLAAEIGVDKSLVGRWVSGSVVPSAHNLAIVTAFVAKKVDGFTMLDWDRDLPEIAGMFGVAPLQARATEPVRGKPAEPLAAIFPFMPGLLELSRVETAQRGAFYEGIYDATVASPAQDNFFWHDKVMLRARNGVLQARWLFSPMDFAGSFFVLNGQLFGMLAAMNTPAFVIANSSDDQNSQMEGVFTSVVMDNAGTISAGRFVWERCADLSADDAADDRMFDERKRARMALLPPDRIAPAIRQRLLPDIGPTAKNAGTGDLMLRSRRPLT